MDNIDVDVLKELPMDRLSEIATAAMKAMQDRKQEELIEAWENFTEKADAIGMTLDDALNKCYKKGYKGARKLPIKFRDPLNPSNEWSGRGRLPNWLKEYEQEGKDINDYMVNED